MSMPLTDEDSAVQAIACLADTTDKQRNAKAKIDDLLATDNPFIDIHELFALYNVLYFRSILLPRVEVSWSPRLTLCAGICELVRDPANRNKYTKLRLKMSEPLLKYRPRSDVLNTLLHEAIHAYFFITTSWRHSRGDDGTGHGSGFLLLAGAINDHGGYNISVYHTFHDEVDSYRTHIWQCDGPCKERPPYFGLVKRSMNRPPGKSDPWWKQHGEECGGSYEKIAEPEMSKQQIAKLSGLARAGRQKSKIDHWLKADESAGKKRVHQDRTSDTQDGSTKRSRMEAACPICGEKVGLDHVNEHLDEKHAT